MNNQVDLDFTRAFVVTIGRDKTYSNRCIKSLDQMCKSMGIPARTKSPGKHIQIILFGDSIPTLDADRLFSHGYSAFRGRPFFLSDPTQLGTHLKGSHSKITSALTELDGRFSLFFLNSKGEFIVATDILGSGAIYYTQIAQQLIVSTHLGLLLACLESFELDEIRGIGCLLARGTGFGKTPFKNIDRLASSSYICGRISEGGSVEMGIHEYADLPKVLGISQEVEEDSISMKQAVDEFDSLLKESFIREKLPADCSISLSGGKDSQCLALAAKKQLGFFPKAVTSSPEDKWGIETCFATSFARKHGQKCSVAQWKLDSQTIDQIVRFGGGAVSLETAKWAAVSALEPNPSMVIVGFLGDLLSGSMLPPENPRWPLLGNRLVPYITLPGLNDNGDLPTRMLLQLNPEAVHVALKDLEVRWQKYSNLNLVARSDLLNFTTRQAGWVSGVTQEFPEIFAPRSCPFYYRPLLRFCLALPRRYRDNQLMYKTWLSQNGWGPPSALLRFAKYSTTVGHNIQGRFRLRPGWNTPAVIQTSRYAGLLEDLASSNFSRDESLREMCRISIEKNRNQQSSGMPSVLSLLPMGVVRHFK